MCTVRLCFELQDGAFFEVPVGHGLLLLLGGGALLAVLVLLLLGGVVVDAPEREK